MSISFSAIRFVRRKQVVTKSAVSVKTKKRFILQSPFGSLEGAFIFAEDVIYDTSAAPIFRERRGNENPIFVFPLPFSLVEDAFSLVCVNIYI